VSAVFPIGGGRYFKLGVLNAQPIYYMYIYTWCVNLLGGLGACPPGNFEKIDARRWDLVIF